MDTHTEVLLMKMGVVSMIRDEADIVHAFLDHLAAFFDVAYLLDHRSADGTSQVLGRRREPQRLEIYAA